MERALLGAVPFSEINNVFNFFFTLKKINITCNAAIFTLNKNNGSVCDSVPESKLITMSLSLLLTSTRPPLLDHSQKPQKNSPFLHIQISEINLPTLTLSSGSGSGSLHEESGHFPLSPPKPTSLHVLVSSAASFYPLYVTAGGILACFNPSAFSWFVKRGPASYS
ncbi:hypothetical protein BDE02_17G053600 [Populus trichocarpa]|nr:hypothetical protein BDE02_17G053600 [Populus trichocarpa]